MSKFLKIKRKADMYSAMLKHVLVTESKEVQEDYIQGLIFLAVADDNFHDEEKKYIEELVKCIDLSVDKIDVMKEFANIPTDDEVLALIERLKAFEEETKVSFLLDASLIAFKDNEFHEIEMELFDEYIKILDLQYHKQNILLLSEILHTKNIDNAISFYTAQRNFYDKFSYMFELLDIDIEKEAKKIFMYEWVEWDFKYGGTLDDKRIATKPVSVRQFCIFINSILMENRLVHINDTTRYELDDGIIISNILHTNLNNESSAFTYDVEIRDEPIVGMGELGINEYVTWFNVFGNYEVELVKFVGDDSGDLEFKNTCVGKPDVLHEVFINEDTYRLYEIDDFNGGYKKLNFYDALPDIHDESIKQVTFRLMKL